MRRVRHGALGLAVAAVALACAPRARSQEPLGFEGKSFGPTWDDPERCRDAYAQGRRTPRKSGTVRVGTWNIKWFPDGKPGKEPSSDGGTDLRWLACAIGSLDVDVLGLQEVKLTPRGEAAMVELVRELDALTSGKWQMLADACADPYRQHVALLFRTDRVELQHIVTHPEIDPTVSRAKQKDPYCPGNLRPALAAYVKSRQGGVDFHFVTSHLDSGREEKDFTNRKAAWARFTTVFERRQALAADEDFVLAGDFNTMGCPKCELQKADDERRLLAEVLLGLTPPLLVAETSAQCSQYYRGLGVLLDQIVLSRHMREAYGAMQLVEGVCARSGCLRLETEQMPAMNRLSDHCPVLLDIKDVDDDGAPVAVTP